MSGTDVSLSFGRLGEGMDIGRRNKMPKRRNRLHRWMVMVLTVALLAGQSHVFVLAEEEQEKCICGMKCAEDAVNTECPVCAADYLICAGEADDTENNNTENNDTENNDQKGDGIENPEGNQDAGIAVEEIQGETVLENELIEDADISLLTANEDDVEVYAVGDTFPDDAGILYRVTDTENREVQVVGYNSGSDITDKLVIPETVTNGDVVYKVTSIGEKAFYVYDNIGSVVIPGSVKSIGDWAFSGCKPFNSVEISDGVTSIGEYAFGACSGLTSVKIPNSVTSIGQYAFHYCKNLSDIEISNHLTSIGKGVFENCKKLGSVEIPSGLTQVGPYMFGGCDNLNHVTIPNTVTYLGDGAFCFSGLSSVEIPNRVTAIGENAFCGCAGLNSVKMPDDLTSIGRGAFEKCNLLESIKISKGVTRIEGYTFTQCTRLNRMQIVIPAGGEIRTLEVLGGVYDGDGPFEGTPDDRSIVFLSEDGSELTGPLLEKAKRAYIEAGKHDDKPDDGKWYGWSLGEPPEIIDTYTVTINVKKDGQPWSDHGRTFALLSNSGDRFFTDLTHVPNGNYRIYDLTGVSPDSYYSRAIDLGVTVTVKDGNTGVVVEVNGGNPEAKDVDYYTVTFYDDTIPYGVETPQRPQIVLSGKTAAKPEDPKKTDYQFTGWKTTNGGNTPYDFENDNVEQAAPKITNIYASWKAGNGDPGSGDAPNPDDDSGTGDTPGPGDGGGTGGASDSGDDGSAGNEQMTVVSEMASRQAKNGADGTPAGNNADPAGNQAAEASGAAANKTEPKTGDATPVEIYATVAMIAGLTYLLLYFMEESRGMTEKEKEVFVAAFIRWAKKGGRFRRGCAVVAIFCLLAYYHSVGKRVGQNALSRKYAIQ